MPRTTFRGTLLKKIQDFLSQVIWLDSVEYALLWDNKEEEVEEENEYEILMDDAFDICKFGLTKEVPVLGYLSPL